MEPTSIMGLIRAALEAFALTMNAIKDGIHWYKEFQAKQWTNDLHETIEELKNAKTPEEKQNAAKKIQDAIRGL